MPYPFKQALLVSRRTCRVRRFAPRMAIMRRNNQEAESLPLLMFRMGAAGKLFNVRVATVFQFIVNADF
jgi:hypothetical protein